MIKVFDIIGNEIETLVNEEKPAGSYKINWYAESLPSRVSDKGGYLPASRHGASGVYFYRL
jgi:hypothetical protein